MVGGMLAKGRVAGACLAVTVALAGCGTATKGGSSVITAAGRTLSVYAGQPPGAPTPAITDTLDAEQLALQQAQGRAGSFSVRLIPVHAHELSANARTAIENASTIAYLGELVPGTSQVSVEITNQQGVLEVSPADTAAYLTQPVPGVSTSTTAFYPGHSTYKQTFARVVPNSTHEAKALVGAMQAAHATSVYVTGDQTLYGQTLAGEVTQAAKAAGLTIAGSPGQAQAYFYGASTSSPAARQAAVRAFDQAAPASPTVKLYAPSGLYDPAFVSGLSAAARARLFVSSPGFLPGSLPAAGKTFVRTFTARYGHAPSPRAIFGYEAMSAVLADLVQAGAKANQRATVVTDFRSLKRTDSPLGAYTISGGDPSIAPLILAHVRAGQLVAFKTLSG
jgi:ABC-type branched-subunit amino acid transport system substrate-binding protein